MSALLPLRVRCLEQSLTLYWLLRRRGVQVSLRLGVNPYRFRAHAWIEYDGKAIEEDPESIAALSPLPGLPGRLPV
jgi:hypothetical protein